MLINSQSIKFEVIDGPDHNNTNHFPMPNPISALLIRYSMQYYHRNRTEFVVAVVVFGQIIILNGDFVYLISEFLYFRLAIIYQGLGLFG